MKRMQLDVHTHTVASGHAYATITEMCRAAQEKELKLLGITEHTSGIPGICNDLYFLNLSVVPRDWDGMQLMLGAEVNIVDDKGTLDLAEAYLRRLDLVIAGHHSFCYTAGTLAENTDGVVGAMTNPYVNIISHPDDGHCPLDYEALVSAAIRYCVLLEINNNSLRSTHRKNVRKNALRILELCKKRAHPVLVSSDAHFTTDVGNMNHVVPLLEEAGFPDELVINCDLESFLAFIKKKSGRR